MQDKKQEIETITPDELKKKIIEGGQAPEAASEIVDSMVETAIHQARLRELNERMVELNNALQKNQASLAQYEKDIMVLNQSITLHTGALQDCQFWIEAENEKIKKLSNPSIKEAADGKGNK